MSVEFIEKVAGVTVDINKLLKEYQLVEDRVRDTRHLNSAVLIQKNFYLISQNECEPTYSQMPYTAEVVELVRSLLPVSIVTYRVLMPNTCYTWHVDSKGICAHIPLITNDGSFFAYEHKNFRMPADGSVYLVNNNKDHTFVNAGKNPRLHITFQGDQSTTHLIAGPVFNK